MASKLLKAFASKQRSIGTATKYRQILNNDFPATKVTSLTSNGLKVASENWNTPTCTVGVWINTGSRFETEANNGVAHFLEHLAFKGTEKRTQQQIELEVENKGAHLNAYTSREMTAFYAKCFSKDLPWAVELLSDILKNSKLEQSAVERERGVILREMEEVESNYQEVVFDYLHATAYQGTPLGRTILGPVDNVKNLQPADMKEFIKTNYKAGRMALCAAGGIDHTQLADLAEKHFGDYPASDETGSVPEMSPCRYTGSEIRDRDDAMSLAHIAVGVQGPGWCSPDTIPLMIGASIHGSWDHSNGGGANVSSKLAQKYFSEGGIHSFQHFLTCYHDTSLWGVYFVAEKYKLNEKLETFMKEWVKLCSQVSEGDIDRAKNQLKTHMLLQMDGTTPICEEIGRHMLVYGRRIPVGEMLERIENTTVKEVRDACDKYIYDQCPSLAAIGPVETLPDYNRYREHTWWLRL